MLNYVYSIFFSTITYYGIVIFIISINFLFINLRNKLTYFIFICVIYSIWIFSYGLDGLSLLFLITEFTVFLLLLMTYIYIYATLEFFHKEKPKYVYLLLLTFIYISENLTINLYYYDFYQIINKIVTTDFYLIFYFLFKSNLILTLLITIVIGICSLFFIFVYFSLRFTKNFSFKKSKFLISLRKQNIIKQSKFNINLYSYQK